MKVSIITVNYNNAKGLQPTIDSILNQTFKDYEWIVIDGGSTDGSREIIEQYADKLAFWCSEKDRGVYDAMNKGVAHSSGDYIIFMNSGDVFYNESVLHDVFKDAPDGDIVYGDWTWKYADGREIQAKGPEKANLAFFLHTNICHQAIFVRGEILREEGFNLEFPYYADWAKWIQLTVQGCSFLHVPVKVCRYEMGGMSEANRRKAEEELEQIHKKYLPEYVLAIKDEIEVANNMAESRVLKDAYHLVRSGKMYKKLIHANVRLVKLLHKILAR